MSKKISNKFDPYNRQILYDFWDNLPEWTILKDEESYRSHFARKIVYMILNKGFEEKVDGEIVIRRALSVQEIHHKMQELIEEKKDVMIEQGIKNLDVSLHNLYFHLRALEEIGLIRTVAILKEGRHNVTYYGPAARVMLFKEDYEEDENVKNVFKAMTKIAKFLNPEFKSDKIMEYYKRFVEIQQASLDWIQDEVIKREDIVQKAEIDPNELKAFLIILNAQNQKLLDLFEEMSKELKLDLWK